MHCRCSLRAVREGRVVLVDGNQMFSRPGPRLVEGLEFLAGLLHNCHDLIPAGFPWQYWSSTQSNGVGSSKHELVAAAAQHHIQQQPAKESPEAGAASSDVRSQDDSQTQVLQACSNSEGSDS